MLNISNIKLKLGCLLININILDKIKLYKVGWLFIFLFKICLRKNMYFKKDICVCIIVFFVNVCLIMVLGSYK